MIKSAQVSHTETDQKQCKVITTMAEMTRINTKVNSTTYE